MESSRKLCQQSFFWGGQGRILICTIQAFGEKGLSVIATMGQRHLHNYFISQVTHNSLYGKQPTTMSADSFFFGGGAREYTYLYNSG